MPKRHSLGALKKRIPQVKQETDDARLAKRARKAERRARSSSSRLPSFALEDQRCGQTHEQVLTSKHVQEWFREAITKRISWSVTLPPSNKWWGGKQRTLAKKLLEAYGGELVKNAIFYLCDNWEEMVKSRQGSLSGIPTVELLWGGRDRIFPMAELGLSFVASRTVTRTRNDLDEYKDPEDDAVGHGW